MLVIYNSLTQKKETFTPLVDGKVSMYVCGNTVYDYCHLGHARTMVAFDLIVRHLKSIGYDVNYVRNITDIDDKIINRANENGETIDELTGRMIAAQREDEKALGLLTPSLEPKATDHIAEIISLISTLIESKHAYVGGDGDVFFRVKSFGNYGQLSKKSIDDLLSGMRVDVNDNKENPLDFVLWKKAKAGEPSYPSPWGEGRPGWHIECSAMSGKHLGDTFDIHGGGFDLQFPHHENEIAQSVAATKGEFARVWMHTGFLQVNKEKMSKSLGNFFVIKDALNEFSGEVLRYFFCASHYRSQLNYSRDNLTHAHDSLKRLYQALASIDLPANAVPNENWLEQYNQAMNDDFNTPKALSVLFDLAKAVNKAQENDKAELAVTLRALGERLGILQLNPHTFLQEGESSESVQLIESLIAKRNEARANKDWAHADAFRDELTKLGIELLDGADGTQWRKI